MSFSISNTVLGITGGVASGKSTVVGMFAALGAATISADAVARDLLQPGTELTRQIIKAFGPEFAADGNPDEVDRVKLAALIFADPAARKRVGEIMHPPIHALLDSYIHDARIDVNYDLVAVEIPLLYENHLEGFVDHVLVVTCSDETQIRRILSRNASLGVVDARRRIDAQFPLPEKAARADYVIDSDRPLAAVERDVADLYDTLRRI